MNQLKLKIPSEFYNSEYRDEYFISEKMKKVWAVELDLLNELLNVCKRNNIPIYASGGTLLGAVRHKGFIPWDDDIDMMMFRSDYEKLCSIASEEFKYPYFFQTNESDPGSLRGHAQLRNSETTGILTSELEWKLPFNQGIFIDIFPLDSVIPNKLHYSLFSKKLKFIKKIGIYYGMFTSRYTKYAPKIYFQIVKNILHKIHIFLGNSDTNPFYETFIRLCTKYNYMTDTEMVTSLCLDATKLRHQKFRKDFDGVISADFEFIKIPVQENYEHALEQEYGDWKKVVKGTSCHGNIFFDPDKAYTEYLK